MFNITLARQQAQMEVNDEHKELIYSFIFFPELISSHPPPGDQVGTEGAVEEGNRGAEAWRRLLQQLLW